jgi:ABC-2 type transport system ATP-binding protein
VTTHQVEEIQDVLTDLVFINNGRVVFTSTMEDFESRYLEVAVRADRLEAARAFRPIHERQLLGRSILLIDLSATGAHRDQLAALGEVRKPSIADLFVALMGGTQ